MVDNIVAIRPENSPLVVDFFGKLFGSSLPFPPEAVQYFIASFSAKNISLAEKRPGSLLVGIKRDNALAAFVMGTPPEGGVATIVWLVVSPEWQKTGLGEKLFVAACEHYKGCGAHKVKLTAPTTRAVNFYEKMGMTQEGFHPDHWWKMDFWSLGMNLKNI